MGGTIRRLKRTVEEVTKASGLTSEDAQLAEQIVLSITRNGKCHLSEVARMVDEGGPLLDTERELSEQLADEESSLDRLRVGWLLVAAKPARDLPFIAVDGTDHAKPYGKAFEYLDMVRDASDPEKRTVPGYWSVQIDALDEQHRHLPLWSEAFSTKDPAYTGWYKTFLQAMIQVIARVGREHTWLFDRGFDANDFLKSLQALQIPWVVRQLQTRHVVLGNDARVLMQQLAAGLHKPHSVEVPYVDKRTHAAEQYTASFGFAPVRLPKIGARLTMIVIDGGRKEDIVLLTNAHITSAEQVASIVLAYMRRWGSEEATRAFKQLTGVEDFRVRKWNAIRRLTFLATLACGVQALMLLTRPSIALRYIARIKHFIENVLLQHYRLWRGIADALAEGG
jgi:hypothetical protein